VIRYSENHHLNTDEEGTNVHIAIHLQGVSLAQAKGFVDVVLATASESNPANEGTDPTRGGTVLRPQTSGPCVHVDQATDDDPDAVQVLGLACRHPGGECPHLETPAVLCPVKDSCYAMREVARMREACEAEQEEQDMAIAAEAEQIASSPTDARVAPRGRSWIFEEDAVIRTATSAAGAQIAYLETFPNSERTPAAISSRWYKLRQRPPPAPVTQSEDAIDTDDGSDDLLSRELPGAVTLPSSWIGMHVRVLEPQDLVNRTGTVIQYNTGPRELLVALDDSLERVWLPPESLLPLMDRRPRE